MPRSFRTQQSHDEERITRDLIAPFLRERGFREIEDQRKRYGQNQSQTIQTIDNAGRRIAMGVRLCWRKRGNKSEENYAATQLLSRIANNDWEGTLTQKMARETADGKTHLLLVERAASVIRHAALIPIDSVVSIWAEQRDTSQRLIDDGRLGKRKKNHAMNGSSPTLYLRESSAPEVAAALWNSPGVLDLAMLPLSPDKPSTGSDDDSMDDLPSFDYSALGSDGTPRVPRVISGVPRDPAVRRAVIMRSGGSCERAGCGTSRDYPGFLDVHHILSAEKSDRAWTCVALCPNCHREVHASPDRDRINGELLKFASQFS